MRGRRFSAANRTIKISFNNEFLTVGRVFLQPAEGVTYIYGGSRMLQASGSCIFESIQRGEIDRVSHLLQQDRGVLKQKGESLF